MARAYSMVTFKYMRVSVIATVKNEGDALRRLLDSLDNQIRTPDEVVICDGGSTDDTLALLETYQEQLPLKIVIASGSNISQGRNRAIAAASGPIIAVTDAGVTLDPAWIAELIRPIEEEDAYVASGWFEADPSTDFEVVMSATVLPDLSDIDPEAFLPSSRSVAFRKEAWQAVGGYPEWLDYSEDLIFDLALRERYGPFPFTPKAVVYFRPRGDISAFARQYYRYARGDGKANLWPKRHAIRYATYLIALPTLSGLIWGGRWLAWLALIVGGALYCYRPVRKLLPAISNWQPIPQLKSIALIPLIRLVGDLSKMAGYPAGLLWRWKYRRSEGIS